MKIKRCYMLTIWFVIGFNLIVLAINGMVFLEHKSRYRFLESVLILSHDSCYSNMRQENLFMEANRENIHATISQILAMIRYIGSQEDLTKVADDWAATAGDAPAVLRTLKDALEENGFLEKRELREIKSLYQTLSVAYNRFFKRVIKENNKSTLSPGYSRLLETLYSESLDVTFPQEN